MADEKRDLEASAASSQRPSLEKSDSSATAVSSGDKSFGVAKAEASAVYFTRPWLGAFFASLALCAYCISLDQYTCTSYEVQALATTFGVHSLIATINTVQSIFACVGQLPMAKICDMFGRFEAFCAAIFCYTLGYIIVSSSPNIGAYAVGTCIYQIGLTGFWLIVQVIVADFTSLRARVFWTTSPSILGTINVWVSGNVAEGIIANSTWRWGFGMFTILIPALISPVIGILAWNEHRARKAGALEHIVAPWKLGSAGKFARSLVVDMDLLGLLLLVASFTCILIPLTIYSQFPDGWTTPNVLAPLIIGCLLLPCFVIYEGWFSPKPMLPLYLFKRRSITCGFLLSALLIMSDRLVGTYLYTWYIVSSDETVLSATRLYGLSSFCSVLSTAVVGLIIIKIRMNKPIMIAGACLLIISYGLMTRFRGSSSSTGELAVLQVIRGISYGPIVYPAQSGVQAAVKHEQVAIVTAAFLAIYYLSAGIGSAIGGAIWQTVLPDKLNQYLGQPELAATVFADPITFAAENPVGTVLRDAVVRAYDDAQYILVCSGVGLAVCVLILCAFVNNPKLGDTITLPEVEQGSTIKPGAMAGNAERNDVRAGHEAGVREKL